MTPVLRMPDPIRNLGATMGAILALAAVLALQGCSTSNASDGSEPTPAGVFTDTTLTAHLEQAFGEAKACTELSNGAFADTTVVMMPPSFPCRWYNHSCSGEFVTPNTIKLGSPYVWKHEAIHYLLYLNTGDADPNHTSPFFQSCI